MMKKKIKKANGAKVLILNDFSFQGTQLEERKYLFVTTWFNFELCEICLLNVRKPLNKYSIIFTATCCLIQQ